MHILDELAARGLVADVTDKDGLRELMSNENVPHYAGHDPTATSLHVGHLVPIIAQARLQKAGHKPIVVVGGATGMIGDPSGKSDERQLLGVDDLAENVTGIRDQLSRFLEFGSGPTDAVMSNNADWLAGIGFLEFLRDVGKHLTINYMMAKDSVRNRLEDRDQGISYTEFSYMLLQAYDFVHLSREYGCKLQVGGSDQWGNITAGTELQRKLGGPQLYGLTCPLLLDAGGQKMGKTSTGLRVWLDPKLTSPYAFYQYWLNVEDSSVERLLKLFSWRPLDELNDIVTRHAEAPQRREGQSTLAADITSWVHGAEETQRAIGASKVMFGGSLDSLTDKDLEPLLDILPSSEMSRDELAAGLSLVDLLVRCSLANSNGAARRLIAGGGVYINNVRADASASVTTAQLGTESMMVVRAGKKNYHVLRVG